MHKKPKRKRQRYTLRGGNKKTKAEEAAAEANKMAALDIVAQQYWGPVGSRKAVQEAYEAKRAMDDLPDELPSVQQAYDERSREWWDRRETARAIPRVSKDMYEAFHRQPFNPRSPDELKALYTKLPAYKKKPELFGMYY